MGPFRSSLVALGVAMPALLLPVACSSSPPSGTDHTRHASEALVPLNIVNTSQALPERAVGNWSDGSATLIARKGRSGKALLLGAIGGVRHSDLKILGEEIAGPDNGLMQNLVRVDLAALPMLVSAWTK